jgi:starch-binding outer membrane protein, SusD/RagB family
MKLKYYHLFILLILLVSCKKDFLDAKSDKKLVVPSTLSDFQALLDNSDIMNSWMPYQGEISADDYYLKYDAWNTLTSPIEKNGYIWAKDVYEGTASFDWDYMYRLIFYSNNVLEGLDRMKNTDDVKKYNEIKGSALFFRAYGFYQAAQIFCAPYSASSANDGLGIPLRLKSDINLPSTRATIAQTYTQILSDLAESLPLLPANVAYKTRPDKTAAYAMLSKIYLLMQDYDHSLLFADSAIMGPQNELINFNDLDTSSAYPMQQYNSEVIFQTTLNYARNFTTSRINIDTVLFQSYANNDIRKAAWFTVNNKHLVFKGSYNGSSPYFFSGLALDEMYLNKAECLARKGKVEEAMNTLNTLLANRFIAGTFTPLTASDFNDALALILKERRKELLLRGIRWSDLRRLNLDPATAKTLYRILNGQEYELQPNSPNYVFPIEDNVILMSGIGQNPRN